MYFVQIISCFFQEVVHFDLKKRNDENWTHVKLTLAFLSSWRCNLWILEKILMMIHAIRKFVFWSTLYSAVRTNLRLMMRQFWARIAWFIISGTPHPDVSISTPLSRDRGPSADYGTYSSEVVCVGSCPVCKVSHSSGSRRKTLTIFYCSVGSSVSKVARDHRRKQTTDIDIMERHWMSTRKVEPWIMMKNTNW